MPLLSSGHLFALWCKSTGSPSHQSCPFSPAILGRWSQDLRGPIMLLTGTACLAFPAFPDTCQGISATCLCEQRKAEVSLSTETHQGEPVWCISVSGQHIIRCLTGSIGGTTMFCPVEQIRCVGTYPGTADLLNLMTSVSSLKCHPALTWHCTGVKTMWSAQAHTESLWWLKDLNTGLTSPIYSPNQCTILSHSVCAQIQFHPSLK